LGSVQRHPSGRNPVTTALAILKLTHTLKTEGVQFLYTIPYSFQAMILSCTLKGAIKSAAFYNARLLRGRLDIARGHFVTRVQSPFSCSLSKTLCTLTFRQKYMYLKVFGGYRLKF
jgi:hypothetical protein